MLPLGSGHISGEVMAPALPGVFVGVGLLVLAPFVYRFEPSFRHLVRAFWGKREQSEASKRITAIGSALIVGFIGAGFLAGGIIGLPHRASVW
jgi:hypothetical protein